MPVNDRIYTQIRVANSLFHVTQGVFVPGSYNNLLRFGNGNGGDFFQRNPGAVIINHYVLNQSRSRPAGAQTGQIVLETLNDFFQFGFDFKNHVKHIKRKTLKSEAIKPLPSQLRKRKLKLKSSVSYYICSIKFSSANRLLAFVSFKIIEVFKIERIISGIFPASYFAAAFSAFSQKFTFTTKSFKPSFSKNMSRNKKSPASNKSSFPFSFFKISSTKTKRPVADLSISSKIASCSSSWGSESISSAKAGLPMAFLAATRAVFSSAPFPFNSR